jgi:hypothetical protein
VSTVTVPATGGASLTLPNLTGTTSQVLTLPAGTGTITIRVNGQVCGTATLVAGSTSTVTLPETCAAANGTVTLINAAGQQLSTVVTIGADGSGTVTVPNLNPATVNVVLPAGPTGAINIMSGGVLCGSGTISAGGVTTVALSAACSVGGLPLTFTSGTCVLGTTATVPGTITTTNGTLTLASLTAATPLTISVPAGTGTLTTLINGVVTGSTTLSSSGSTTVTLPVTCANAGQTVSFAVNGTPVTSTLAVPATGGGTLVLSNLQTAPAVVVPTPAKTGNAGLDGGNTSTMLLAGLLATAMGAVVGARLMARRD